MVGKELYQGECTLDSDPRNRFLLSIKGHSSGDYGLPIICINGIECGVVPDSVGTKELDKYGAALVESLENDTVVFPQGMDSKLQLVIRPISSPQSDPLRSPA